MEWWEALITSVLGGTVVALVNWFLGGTKRAAEIRLIDSQTEKARVESEKILSEISTMRRDQAVALTEISETAHRAAESAEQVTEAVLGSESAKKQLSMLRKLLDDPRASAWADEVPQLTSVGLIRVDSAGKCHPTPLARRLLAKGA